MRRSRTALALMGGVAAAITIGSTLASAAPRAAEDGGDAFNVAKGTQVTATNSGNVVFRANTSVGTVIVTCSLSTFGGKTGLTLKFNVAPAVFSDAAGPCTDNFGHTDALASNSANGKWSVKEKDQSSDEGLPEPNATGDKITLTIPKAGIVDTNSLAPGCTATLAPSAAAHVTGTYNDAGTLTIANAPIPVAFSAACSPVTGTSATMTATFTVGPAIFDQG